MLLHSCRCSCDARVLFRVRWRNRLGNMRDMYPRIYWVAATIGEHCSFKLGALVRSKPQTHNIIRKERQRTNDVDSYGDKDRNGAGSRRVPAL